jgi:hypothetical protein
MYVCMYVEERGGGRERASDRQSCELCVMIVSPSLSEWRDDGGREEERTRNCSERMESHS